MILETAATLALPRRMKTKHLAPRVALPFRDYNEYKSFTPTDPKGTDGMALNAPLIGRRSMRRPWTASTWNSGRCRETLKYHSSANGGVYPRPASALWSGPRLP